MSDLMDNTKKIVYIPEFIPPAEPQLEIFSEVAIVETGEARDEADLIARVSRADAVLVTYKTKMTGAVIRACPRLRIIGKYGVGIENIDIATATERGIPVVYVPGMNSSAVAELTIGLMLAVMRGIQRGKTHIAGGKWRDQSFVGGELAGGRIGVVGYGNISRSVIRKLQGFDVERIYVYSKHGTEADAEWDNVRFTDLRTLLKESDVVTLHNNLTPQTKGMIGAAEIELMKKTAYLVNTARGPVLDEQALITALKEQRIAGAALDVFETDPLSPHSPLLQMENVVVMPHTGASGLRTRVKTVSRAAKNVAELLKGRPIDPIFHVNPEVLSAESAGWKERGTT